ncbi:MAG: 2,3-bisphosphoglycerate-independent phosphoglycerate mutase, partial [Maribacter sp.]|nr:2,3-bisphosphoglycerate-independent phosphoglycerate mutase [Maribacter sp.]
MISKKMMLIILDGWGIGPEYTADAIAQADTPVMDKLFSTKPSSTLVTFGEAVGLPEGQMGNSEVGHLNIGAGRIVYQELARINKAIHDKELAQNAQLQNAIKKAKSSGGAFHLLGLVSDGGVHSHINHLKAITDILEDAGLKKIYIHAFLDGRDTSPTGGKGYLQELLTHLEGKSTSLATIIGRYYAMDRDNRWERTKDAYDLLVHQKAK